jgi:hypothetical protein
MMTDRSNTTRSASALAPIVFGIFTLIGAVFIMCAKLFGTPSFLVTGVPIALMIIYALLIVLGRGLRLRDDQTGDNFYYMGFIFTLVSLGVSLYQFSGGGGIDEIVRNFGVAVGSTIAGIVLRIMFNQVRRDPIEVEHVSRIELADAARRVRRELEGVQLEIAHFRRSSLQMIKEGHEETRAQLAELAKSALDAVQDASKQAVDTVRESTDGLGSQLANSDVKSQIEKTARSLDRITKKIDTAAEHLASAADTLAMRLSGVEMPDRVVEVKMQPAVDGLEKVLNVVVDRLEQQTREVSRLRKDVNDTRAETLSRATSLAPNIDEHQATAGRSGFMGGLLRRRDVEGAPSVDRSGEPS